MITNEQLPRIAKRLTDEIGIRRDVGDFVERFAFLNKGHDIEYALDLLKTTSEPAMTKAINIMLEEIVK